MREDTGQRVVSLVGTGGYAEYVAADEATTFPIEEDVSDATALALLLQGLTAWHLYRTSAKLAAGESVVVHAAAGGVGSLAVQLGRHMGAGRVIATASTQEKRDLALELGADAAVDVNADDLAGALIEANGGERVDAVFEMAGGRVFEESMKALAPFGRMVTYGIASREQNEVRTGALMRRSHAVVGFWLMHCLREPEHGRRAAAGAVRARRERRPARRRGRVLPAVGGPPRPRGPRRPPHLGQARARPGSLGSRTSTALRREGEGASAAARRCARAARHHGRRAEQCRARPECHGAEHG